MIVVDIIHLTLAVLIAMFVLRYLQTKISSEGTTGKALAYILH